MKKLLLSLLFVVPLVGQAQTATPVSFTLKGKIGKLDAPAKLYLVRDGRYSDSTALKNGTFELRGTTDIPKTATLLLQRQGRIKATSPWQFERVVVFLEPGPVVINSPDSLHKAAVTGGRLSAEYNQLQASLKPLGAKFAALWAEHQKAPDAQRQTPAFKQRMEARQEALKKEREQCYGAFIKAHPTSWVSFDALQEIAGSRPEYNQVAPHFEALSPTLKNTPAGRKYAEMLQALKRVAIGAQAPDFSQLTPDGRTVSLTDYRGKYVLVDFWASWCGPCRQENPTVAKVYQDYKDRNFEVLGVSLDDEKGREKWLKAIQDDQLTWTQVSDLKGWQNEAAKQYNVKGIPDNYLIDPDGKIIASGLRGEGLREVLARFIK